MTEHIVTTTKDDPPGTARISDAAATSATNPWEALPRLRDLIRRHPFAICDASSLPLPKAEMKIALKVAWDLAACDTQRAEIEAGFLHLSQFQDGIGAEPIDGDFPATADPAETAALVNRWVPWSELCQDDKWSLWVELVAFKQQRRAQSVAQAA
jgi:hypothetical protein